MNTKADDKALATMLAAAQSAPADERDALRAEVKRLREAIIALAEIAHEHRHELMQQRFPDNDEGDAFARHRDSRMGRIDRILRASLAASTGQEVGK